MIGITTYLSILKLNVNEINSSIKRHCLAKWIKKEIQQSVANRKPISSTEIHSLRVKGWKKFSKPITPKTGSSSSTYLREGRLQTYSDQMK
jgi:hypothetical protein